MKSVTTVLFFLALSASLFAQNDSIQPYIESHFAKPAKNWHSMNLHFGLDYTNTEGVFKDFIKSNVAFNYGFEMHKRHILAINASMRTASLNKTFTHENQTWKSDTSIYLTTIQGLLGLQVWASQRTALYFVGALGLHEIAAGKRSTGNNENCDCDCPEKTEGWTIVSFAPSVGIFFDVRQRAIQTNWGFQDHYVRLKFMAHPTSFKTVGNGVLYDMGVGYSF